ncbi:glycosyltransferase family 2 protein [Aerococcus urinaeequi]|uniref:glycosyltransferase family 2 protein n=1 Tax=Aerococcus urinaeequi TaxID=51665 RepID=UPI003D6B4AF8
MHKFSVIIPTYNVENYIEKCLVSVMSQTFTDYEIIIVDDCSQDDTIKKIYKIMNNNPDTKIQLYKNDKNSGASYSRNKAITKSSGEYIVILDSDDFFLDNRLEIINNYLSSHNVDVLFDNLIYFYDGKEKTYTNAYSLKNLKVDKLTKVNIEDFVLNDLGYLKGVIRRKLLIDNNIYYDEQIGIGEDFLFYITCFHSEAKVFLIPEALYMYRQRNNSLSHNLNEKNFTDRIKSSEKLLEYCDSKKDPNNRLKKALRNRLKVQNKEYNYFKFSNLVKNKKYIQSLLFILKNPNIIINIWEIFIK